MDMRMLWPPTHRLTPPRVQAMVLSCESGLPEARCSLIAPALSWRIRLMRGRFDLCQLDRRFQLPGVAKILHVLSNPGEICGGAA